MQLLKHVLGKEFQTIEALRETERPLRGLPTGFVPLDDITAGLHPGQLIIIAGDPSIGKTALCLCIARNIAVEEELPVAIFSLVDNQDQLSQRLLCAEARVALNLYLTHQLPDQAWANLSLSVGKLAEAPFFIDDTKTVSLSALVDKINNAHTEHNIALAVIDPLHLIQRIKNADNESDSLMRITASIKELAAQIQIPIIATAMLKKRQLYPARDIYPSLQHIKGSSAIADIADLVGYLYAPGSLHKEGRYIRNLAGLKHRNGPKFDIELAWIGKYAKFENLAPDFRAWIQKE